MSRVAPVNAVVCLQISHEELHDIGEAKSSMAVEDVVDRKAQKERLRYRWARAHV